MTFNLTPQQLTAIVQAVDDWVQIKRRFVQGQAMMHEVIEVEGRMMRLMDEVKG